MDSDIGGILRKRGRAEKDFCQLRISKYPANAHKTNYFSALVIGCFD